MPRHHIVQKIRSLALLSLLLTGLVVLSYAVPSIDVAVRPIGSCTAERYYMDVNVTNLEGLDLVNYTFNITVPAGEIPAYSKLKVGNVYVVDENGDPLYYWVMRRTSKVFTVFFQVPYVPAGGWRIIRIYYGSDNPYRGYRNPRKLFVYFENFNSLGDYPHVDTRIFSNSQAFGSGELSVSRGKLVVNSTISTFIFSTSKEAELTRLTVDDSYGVVFKFRRKSDVQDAESYPFYMFIHTRIGRRDRYDYVAIKESSGKFRFEFGNDWNGAFETAKRAGKQYYLGEILVTPRNSTGRVEKFSSGDLIGSHVFETNGRFRNREVSIGFGQANADIFGTVNLLAYVDWVYVVRYASYNAHIIGMGAECSFN